MSFVFFSLDIGHNPLPALRDAFDEFKWTFFQWDEYSTMPKEVVGANYIWHLVGTMVLATKEPVPHHFFCTYANDVDEIPKEIQEGFQVVKIPSE